MVVIFGFGMVFGKGLQKIPWNKGIPMSEEAKKKSSEAHKGKPSPNKGKTASEETRRKISFANKGKPTWMKGKHHTLEARLKLSLSHKGQLAWNKGKHPSEETIKKQMETHRMTLSNPAVRKRLSDAHKGQISPMKGKHHTEKTKMKIRGSLKGKHYSTRTEFKKGLTPWIKGKTHSEETKKKLKETRAKQVFPLKDSSSEIKIQNFLKQLNIEFLTHKYMSIEHAYQCDIFIPSLNLVIECDGEAFHFNPSNPKAYVVFKKTISGRIGLTAEQKRKLDVDRTKELREKGFEVLRLWESDINVMNLNDFMLALKPFQKI